MSFFTPRVIPSWARVRLQNAAKTRLAKGPPGCTSPWHPHCNAGSPAPVWRSQDKRERRETNETQQPWNIVTGNRFRNHSVSIMDSMDSLFGCDFWAKHTKAVSVWTLFIPLHLLWRCSLENVLKRLGSLRSPQLTLGRICHFQSNYVNKSLKKINRIKHD